MDIRRNGRVARWCLVAGIMGIALLMGMGAMTDMYPPRGPLSVTLATEPLATLLPHFHGPGDRVDDQGHGVEVRAPYTVVPHDLWVTDIDITMDNAPASIIHHLYAAAIDPGAATSSARLLLIAGQDTKTSFSMPAPAGIFLRKGTVLMMTALLHDAVPPEGPGGIYKDVSARLTLAGVPPGKGRYLQAVYGIIGLSDTDPGPPSLDHELSFVVPAATSTYVRTSAMNPPSTSFGSYVFGGSGWIIGLGGHMHAWEGGKEVDAYLDGARIAEYRPHLANPREPWSWQTNVGPRFIRYGPGQKLTMSVTYENDGTAPIEGAMGHLGFYYVPDRFMVGFDGHEMDWRMRALAYPLLEAVGIWPRS